MNPQHIAAVINAAGHAMKVSPKAVAGVLGTPTTWHISNARRCAAIQLHKLGLPDAHNAASLGLRKIDFSITLRIGALLMRCEPDATIHRAIAAAVPGAFAVESTILPLEAIIRAATDLVGLDSWHIRRRTRLAAARDHRLAALYLAITQGSPFSEVAAAFNLADTTSPNTSIANAKDLTTCDVRFSGILSSIHTQASGRVPALA